MPQGDPVAVAIVGLDHWYWAYGIAYAVATSDVAELAAIADDNAGRARHMAGIFGARSWTTDYREILARPEVTGVVVTTTTARHEEVAAAAAAAGKAVLVNKPLARTLRSADRIITRTREAGVTLIAAGAWPLPGDQVMGLIEEGAVGTPYMVHSSILALPPMREPGGQDPGWFADPAQAAGGGFIDHAINEAGIVRACLGGQVTSVYGRLGRHRFKDWAVEDHGIAVLDLDNGTRATLEASFTAPTHTQTRRLIVGTAGQIEVTSVAGTGARRVEVWNHKGRQTFHVLAESPTRQNTYAKFAVPTPPNVESYGPIARHFIDVLRGVQSPVQTGPHARANLEICLAAYASARTGLPVTLPLREDVDVPAVLADLTS